MRRGALTAPALAAQVEELATGFAALTGAMASLPHQIAAAVAAAVAAVAVANAANTELPGHSDGANAPDYNV